MMFGLLIIVPLGIAIIWFILNEREKGRERQGLRRFSGIRLAIASFFILTALFSGGCSLVIGISEFNRAHGGADDFMNWQLVAIVGGIPFVISAFIGWLVMRRGG